MILNKFNAFNTFFVALALCCLMADQVKAGKMTRNITTVASAKNTTIIRPKETEAEDTTTTTTLDDKQVTTSAPSVDATADDDSLSILGIVRSIWNWIREDFSLLASDTDDDASSTTSLSRSSTAASFSSSSSSSSSAPVAAVEGRTFGKIRRLQMALIPIIFKFGVLSAMVAFLVLLGVKTLFLIKVLILMNAAALLGKFLTLKTNFAHYEHAPIVHTPIPWGYNNWSPHNTFSQHGWSSGPTAPAVHQAPSKEIHLHIHGAQTQPQVSAYTTYGNIPQSHSNGWERRSDPYGAYEPPTISEADVENELNNQGPIGALPTKYPSNHRY